MTSTILCAQEDRNLRRSYEQALKAEGYRVLAAGDGNQTLERARDGNPDLILLDVMLPKRDGFSVLEEIRQQRGSQSRVPVMLLSACSVSPQYEARAERMGAAGILTKPVPIDVLVGHVREIVKPDTATVSTRRQASPPSLEGSFREIDFSELLHQLHGMRASGVLHLENGKKKKIVQFEDGYAVSVKSNLITECLGNMLVRRGDLSQQALEESLVRVKKGEGLQGEILVAMESVDEETISAALQEQARDKLFEIFGWKRGQFKFQKGRKLQRGNTLALDCSPANIVVQGARQHVPLAKIDAFIEHHAGRFLVHGESPFYRFQSIDLSGEEERVISELDGSRELGHYRDASESVRRTLYALVVIELLAMRDGPGDGAPAANRSETGPPGRAEEASLRTELTAMANRMRDQNHYELLGLASTTDDASVRRAYEAKVRRVHPDVHHNANSVVKQLADEIYSRLNVAHDALADAEQRARYADELKKGAKQERSQARGRQALAAETAFQRGEAAMRKRDYEGALLCFGRALEHLPEEGEYHAHYGWCLHLCHPDNSVIVQEAIEHVQRGIKLARDREKPYLFLGRLYKVVGKMSVAEKMFTRAVQLRPDCVEALRELRLINMRRDKSNGIFRRLLRR